MRRRQAAPRAFVPALIAGLVLVGLASGSAGARQDKIVIPFERYTTPTTTKEYEGAVTVTVSGQIAYTRDGKDVCRWDPFYFLGPARDSGGCGIKAPYPKPTFFIGPENAPPNSAARAAVRE